MYHLLQSQVLDIKIAKVCHSSVDACKEYFICTKTKSIHIYDIQLLNFLYRIDLMSYQTILSHLLVNSMHTQDD